MMGEGEYSPEKIEKLKLQFKKFKNPKNKFNLITVEKGCATGERMWH